MDIRNIIRAGKVSSINPNNCTARVTFDTLDDLVSAELPIITRGSLADKDYWLPDVGENVLCVFLPNASGRGVCAGFVLGAYYTSEDTLTENSGDVSAIKFGNGTIIRHDRSSGDLSISVTGNISITAAGTITINGAQINLN